MMHKLSFGTVDLEQLKEQKASLVEITGNMTLRKKYKDDLTGIINLLDAIQDYIEGRKW